MSEYHYQISEASRLLAVEAHVLRYWEEELGMIIPRNEMGHRYYTEEHLRIFSQIKDMKERGYQLRAIRAILSGEEPPETPITEIPLRKNQKDQNEDYGEKNAENRNIGDDKSNRAELYGKHLDSPGKASVEMPSGQNQPDPVKIPRTWTLPAPEMPAPDVQPEPLPQPESQPVPLSPEEPKSQNDQGRELDVQSGDNRMSQFQAVMTHIVAQAMLWNNSGLAKEISRQIEKDVLLEIQKIVNSSEDRQEERFRKLDESIRNIQQSNRARYEAAASKSPGGLFWKRKQKRRYRRI